MYLFSIFCIVFCFLFPNLFSAKAQSAELQGVEAKTPKPLGQISNSLLVSAYAEMFYSYDFSNPAQHIRQPFLCSFNRHNEPNLNMGYLKAAFSQQNIRANVALMAGTYSIDNLGYEPGMLKNLFEANIGFKLSKKRNLWLDAGTFVSHIGFESAIGKDCWNLTRSLLAENSPYYETGAKVTHTSTNEKWLLSMLLLNGWQRIYRQDGSNSPALGHQLTFKPNARTLLNSSSFVGEIRNDSAAPMRYFHNFYGQFQLHQKIGLTLGFDIGLQAGQNRRQYHTWYSPVLILKLKASEKWQLAARTEYYHDAKGVIIATNTTNNFQVFGCSFNIDYFLSDKVLWRVEARSFSAKDPIFQMQLQPSHQNYSFTTSVCISI
jgi:hypothetical protein